MKLLSSSGVNSILLAQNNQQSGAEEACWAHNPEVGGSKPPSATYTFFKILMISIFLLLKMGPVRESNPGPRAPEARIIPLDQRATSVHKHSDPIRSRFRATKNKNRAQ